MRVPTLVTYSPARAELARYVADHIPDADLVEQKPDNREDLMALETFLTRALEEHLRRAAEPDRVLATVLFTDLVGSTAKAIELGPRWQEVLREHTTFGSVGH